MPRFARASRLRYARLGAIAVLPFTAAVWSVPSPAVAEGWTFTWKVSAEGQGPQNSTMQVRVLANNVRVDFQAGTMPGVQGAGFMLLDADKGQMTMVSPQERSAVVMEAGGMTAALDQLSAAGITMNFKDVTSSVDDLGAGERILGHATRKYRITQGYTIEVSAMGFNRTMQIENTIESWMATDFAPADQKAFDEFSKNFAQSMSGMAAIGGEAMKKMAAELQARMPKGFPLKQVQTTSTTDEGRPSTTRSTMEVTSMQKTQLEPSVFQVPAGYTVRTMSDAMKKPPE